MLWARTSHARAKLIHLTFAVQEARLDLLLILGGQSAYACLHLLIETAIKDCYSEHGLPPKLNLILLIFAELAQVYHTDVQVEFVHSLQELGGEF